MSSTTAATCPTCGCQETSCATCSAPDECFDSSSCCCSAAHVAWRQGRLRGAQRLEYYSLAWMSVEVVGSVGVGVLVGSLALIAFGGDSLVEMLSAFVTIRHLEADIRGTRTMGLGTARLSSLLLFSLIPIIGAGAVYSLAAGIRPEGSLLGIAIAVGAVLVMPYLWLQKRRIGRETRCLPLQIDAVESATCFLMSAALLAGLLAEYFLGLWWADYLAAGVILAFVAKEAVEAYHESAEESASPAGAQSSTSPRP